jgi:lipopolysaccharide export LptBFGC system permease protein LptF
MGTTLFGYIFRDLLRVFLLAAAALGGVLSFAGLLRPLSEQGLGPAQAVRILGWLLPAMLVYSLPVAALFATTFVYGRLAADNESTAALAAGIPISPLGLLLPATVLGGILGLSTIGLLGIVVPAANLQVERSIWSNVARITANQINRSNRASFEGVGGAVTVFAERAILPDRDATRRLLERAEASETTAMRFSDDVQLVQLENAYVVRYQETLPTNDDSPPKRLPEEIYAAGSATVFIDPQAMATDDAFEQSALDTPQFAVSLVLEDGVTFPRSVGLHRSSQTSTRPAAAPLVAAAGSAQIGPIRRDLPLRRNVKFMSIDELRTLLRFPDLHPVIDALVQTSARSDQRLVYLRRLAKAADRDEGVELDPTRAIGERSFRLWADGRARPWQDALNYEGIMVRLRQATRLDDGQTEVLEVASDDARIKAETLLASEGGPRMVLTLTFDNAIVSIDGRTTQGRRFERRVVVAVPDDLIPLGQLTSSDFLSERNVELGGMAMPDKQKTGIYSWRLGQNARVIGELHARAAFVLACTILPMIGAALGILARSGNFLIAFALSTVPAAVAISMILFGQQLVEANPPVRIEDLDDIGQFAPSPVAIGLIWSGNLCVAIFGGLLLVRLRSGEDGLFKLPRLPFLSQKVAA